MCPACLASAAVMMAGAVSAGGLTVVVAKLKTKMRLKGSERSQRSR